MTGGCDAANPAGVGEAEYYYRVEAWPTSSVDEWENVYEGPIEGYMRKMRVIKHTARGCWVAVGLLGSDAEKRFVLSGAKRRYACPTSEEALESFLARKQAHKRILASQIRTVDRLIDYATRAFGKKKTPEAK